MLVSRFQVPVGVNDVEFEDGSRPGFGHSEEALRQLWPS